MVTNAVRYESSMECVTVSEMLLQWIDNKALSFPKEAK